MSNRPRTWALAATLATVPTLWAMAIGPSDTPHQAPPPHGGLTTGVAPDTGTATADRSPAAPAAQVSPGTQGSGAGIAGQPGGKSGPAVRAPSGQNLRADQTNPVTRLQDPSAVQGKGGGKSGPTATGR